jgi:hypothetical protein
MLPDRCCTRLLDRPLRAAGALRNERCGKLCNARARQVKRGARRPRSKVLSVEVMYDALLVIAAPGLVSTPVPDAIYCWFIPWGQKQ